MCSLVLASSFAIDHCLSPSRPGVHAARRATDQSSLIFSTHFAVNDPPFDPPPKPVVERAALIAAVEGWLVQDGTVRLPAGCLRGEPVPLTFGSHPRVLCATRQHKIRIALASNGTVLEERLLVTPETEGIPAIRPKPRIHRWADSCRLVPWRFASDGKITLTCELRELDGSGGEQPIWSKLFSVGVPVIDALSERYQMTSTRELEALLVKTCEPNVTLDRDHSSRLAFYLPVESWPADLGLAARMEILREEEVVGSTWARLEYGGQLDKSLLETSVEWKIDPAELKAGERLRLRILGDPLLASRNPSARRLWCGVVVVPIEVRAP